MEPLLDVWGMHFPAADERDQRGFMNTEDHTRVSLHFRKTDFWLSFRKTDIMPEYRVLQIVRKNHGSILQ